ncbi:glycosyltransferase family 4 protein [Zhihengliuella alba]|uniref:glycosyltransferase family 4 protein n=1 Tax=Zhihengliuella alba TaxID=547018 RepID=UPI0031F1674A
MSSAPGPSPIQQAGQLATNLRLTAHTVWDHLTDDPVVLALQTARRLPQRPVHAVARRVADTVRGTDSTVGNIAAAVNGDTVRLEANLADAVARRNELPAGTARRLAEVATAVGDVEAARQLLEVLPDTSAAAAARARLAWHLGSMTEAVELLAGRGGPAAALHRRYASELDVYAGSRPAVTAPRGYRPADGRIMHVLTNSLPHTGSGYAQRSHSILTALAEDGWDVSATTRIGYPVQVGKPLAADQDVVDGLTYRRILPPAIRGGLSGRIQQYADALAGIVGQVRPALLHTTTDFLNAVVVRAVAEAHGIPWVYEVRGQLADTWASGRPAEARTSERYRYFKEREADVARSADAVVTLGEAMKSELVAAGVEAARIRICPNAVGEAFLAEPLEPSAAQAALGLDPGWTYVGTVSSIVAYEGLDDLLSAFALLHAQHPRTRLLVAGDGAALPALKHQAVSLGIADRVVFAGRVPREKAHLYHQALSVFAVPRKDLEVTRQVTPLKSVEASASGRPVVATDLPALAELVHDGVNGRRFAPGDVADLAAKLGELLSDREEAARLGHAGRAWALEERTWSANAEKYEQVYRGLLERPDEPSAARGE